MPQISWSRWMVGERPDLLLGEDRILLHYTAAGGKQKDVHLLCFDLDGCERWFRPGWSGMLSLPGNRFLVNTPEGRPLIVDGDGDILHRWKFGRAERVVRHRDTLLFAQTRQVCAADLRLHRLWDAAWPGAADPATDCFVGGAFYWVEADALRRWTPGGQPEIVCPLPADLIAGAMDEWERTTGRSALSGWYTEPGKADFSSFGVGDRPWFFHWRVAFDEAEGRFLVANAMPPHLLLCLDRSGQPRWCRYLSFGCCGGVPSRLPDGRLVASSGCGGILSWLDGDGDILCQSEPHEGEGLATAYSNDVLVLPDGRCLVDGGPGVVAYGPTGKRLWVFEPGYSQFHCDPARQILVGCYWQNTEPKGPNRVCLELAHGL